VGIGGLAGVEFEEQLFSRSHERFIGQVGGRGFVAATQQFHYYLVLLGL